MIKTFNSREKLSLGIVGNVLGTELWDHNLSFDDMFVKRVKEGL